MKKLGWMKSKHYLLAEWFYLLQHYLLEHCTSRNKQAKK